MLSRFWPIAAAMVIAGWPAILQSLIAEFSHEHLPSALAVVMGLLSVASFAFIRNRYARILAAVWFLWFVVGVANVYSSSVVLGNYYSKVEIDEPMVIYFGFTTVYFLGLLAGGGWRTGQARLLISNDLAGLPSVLLWVFPIAFALSLIGSLGYVPILSGVSIVDEMYGLDYGFVYKYGAVLILSILLVLWWVLNSGAKGVRISLLLALALFILISVMDGKRAFLLVAFAGGIGLLLRSRPNLRPIAVAPIVSIAAAGVYLGVHFVRIADYAGGSETLRALAMVGVEFRDFAYTAQYYEPGQIQQYDWMASLVASLLNGALLNVFGYDKQALMALGSAQAWAALWNSNFGIRTGIVSELWFAYGWFGLFVIVALGYASGRLCLALDRVGRLSHLLFLSALYGLIILLVMSQSTFTAGLLPVFLYCYVGIRGLQLLNKAIFARHRGVYFNV